MSINIKPRRKGLLHKMMHVPVGKTIPVMQLKKSMKNASPAERKRIQFALNARKWKH